MSDERTSADRSSRALLPVGIGALASLMTVSTGEAQALPGAARVAPDGTPYLVTVPASYGLTDAPAPLLLFLHGGDRDNRRHHPARYAREAGIILEFVVVAPHCRPGCRWQEVDMAALLDHVQADYRIDRSRVYLTGYSMGGYGAWHVVSTLPDRFAAAAPIAGGGDPEAVCRARAVPVRAFHGDRDDVIPHARSADMVRALQQCGGDAELTTYVGVGHASWPIAFADPAFYAWFLDHHKTRD